MGLSSVRPPRDRHVTAAACTCAGRYLVRWEGFSATHDTWEHESNILDTNLLEAYDQKALQKHAPKGAPKGAHKAPPRAPSRFVR